MNGKQGHIPRLSIDKIKGGESEFLNLRYSEGDGILPDSGYLLISDLPANVRGEKSGIDLGENGWSPVFEVVSDGSRRVFHVADWVGGDGTKPGIGQYLGASGLVALIGDAVNSRGSGSGANDVTGPVSATNDSLAKFGNLSGGSILGLSRTGVSSLLTKAGFLSVTSQKILANLVAAEVLNSAKITNANHTGDVTGSITLTIAAGAVESSMMVDSIEPGSALNASIRVNEKGLIKEFSQSVTVTTGILMQFAGASIPSGWLACDGSAVSRSTYSDLFAVIGTTHGGGNGTTTFNLPDCRGRVIESGAEGIGAVKGAATHALITAEIPEHSHSFDQKTLKGIQFLFGSSSLSSSYQGSFTGSIGGGGAHNNVQPTIIFNTIIKT
jgi:microcystin-dependent protein